jgi:hypothetical protein
MLTIIGYAALAVLIWTAIALPVDNAIRRSDPEYRAAMHRERRAREQARNVRRAKQYSWQQWLPATIFFCFAVAVYIAYSVSTGSVFGVLLWSCVLALIIARFALKVAVDRQSNRRAAAPSPPRHAPAAH